MTRKRRILNVDDRVVTKYTKDKGTILALEERAIASWPFSRVYAFVSWKDEKMPSKWVAVADLEKG